MGGSLFAIVEASQKVLTGPSSSSEQHSRCHGLRLQLEADAYDERDWKELQLFSIERIFGTWYFVTTYTDLRPRTLLL